MRVLNFLILLITLFLFQFAPAQNDFKSKLTTTQTQKNRIQNIALNTSNLVYSNNDIGGTITYQQSKKFNFILLITLLTFLFSIFTLSLYSKQQKHIKKLEVSLQQGYESKLDSEKKEIDIEKSIIQNVLIGLNYFETNLEFLEQEISLIKLSKKLNTNPSYLSKIINTYKKKKFSNYLNDLRINYVLARLKTDKKLSLYTIKAISEETGYSNSQSFTNAFYKKTGNYPSQYIKELKKQ